MKRRRILLLLALAVVAMGLVLFWLSGPREPVYQGKELSRWITESGVQSALALSEEEPLTSNGAAARKAVRAIAKDALPWLMSQYTRTEPKWRVTLQRWLGRITGRGSLVYAEDIRRAYAIRGLELLGPDLAPALPELAKFFDNQDVGRAATVGYVMAHAGEAAIPYLVEGLATTNLIAGGSAAHGLGWLASQTAAAVPPLLQALQSTNKAVRAGAAAGLGHVTFRPELTIPALIAALGDTDTIVRKYAADSLAIMRKDSAPLVTELQRLIAGTNSALALTASNALYQLETPSLPPGWP